MIDQIAKMCPQCKTDKSLLMFSKDKHTKDGLMCWCKECCQTRGMDYFWNHREERLEYGKNYQEKNRSKRSETRKRWRKNNPEKARLADKKRRSTLRGRLNNNVSIGIRTSLRGNKHRQEWEMLVGYNLEQLEKQLKKTMPPNMTWEDYMEGKMHVDHIIPISAFNFEKSEDIDFKRCWALKNLRLLPKKENLQKYNKLYEPFQPSLIL